MHILDKCIEWVAEKHRRNPSESPPHVSLPLTYETVVEPWEHVKYPFQPNEQPRSLYKSQGIPLTSKGGVFILRGSLACNPPRPQH